jgi:LmbE family N-acetylglucosaminyl deacetylase
MALVIALHSASVATATEEDPIDPWVPACDDNLAQHIWQPQPEQAALMHVFSHPDDESIFFRGAIPYYRVVRDLPVVGICMANNDQVPYDILRRDELRNAFWTMGMRNPPIFGNFPDNCFGQPEECTLNSWDLDAAVEYLTEQIRRYRPEVILTHDFNGEYGHPNHIVTALATSEAYAAASDPLRYPDQLIELDVWQPLKLYVHLYDPNSWEHDWDTPYPELGGRSAQDIVASGILCHVSQAATFRENRGWKFGLYATEVGFDAGDSNFFENIIPVVTQAEADVFSGPAPLTVNFSGAATDHPSDTLTYSWDFGDGNSAAGANVPHDYGTNGVFNATLQVTDGTHTEVSDLVTILVGIPPQASIVEPAHGAVFRAGDLIDFSGMATDADSTPSGANFNWTVLFHHNGHTHVADGPLVGSNGLFQIPSEGEDFSNAIGYEFVLTVTDSDGLTDVTSVTIVPEIVSLTLDSEPSGLLLEFDGKSKQTPFVTNTLVGLTHTISAPETQCENLDTHTFDYWSDGGPIGHVITVPDTAEFLTATYLVCGHCGLPQLDVDFNTSMAGDQPPNWFDTQPNNSLLEDDSFAIFDVDGDPAIGTASTAFNVHSHYIGPGSENWSSYEYRGRLRMSADGGIGLTVLSGFPAVDAYYRLRRYDQSPSNEFHISPHGTSITGGTTSSGVVPTINLWYRFRMTAVDTGSRTEIRAKVWADGSPEPFTWQIDCYDDSVTRLTSGTVGFWCMASGNKYWDDLTVTQLLTDPSCDDLDPCTENDVCSNGVCDGNFVDADGDGACDIFDNCPTIPNAGQANIDADAYGDACDGPFDVDHDGDVDAEDFADFQACMTAPGVPTTVQCQEAHDNDGDADVDLEDFATLQVLFGGP